MKARCKAWTQYSVKFGDNFVEIWYFTGQNVHSEVGPASRLIDKGTESFSVDSNRAICSYKGESQLDAKIEYSWNFNTVDLQAL